MTVARALNEALGDVELAMHAHRCDPKGRQRRLAGTFVAATACVSLLAFPVLGCASNVRPKFEYTDAIRDTITLPILKSELGDAAKFYDPDKPNIHLNPKNRNVVTLSFDWDIMKSRDILQVPLDPPYVEITLNWRTLKVCDQNSLPSYVILSDEETAKRDAVLAVQCR